MTKKENIQQLTSKYLLKADEVINQQALEPKFESNLDLKQKEKRKDSNLQRTTHEKSISLQHTTHEKSIDQLTNRLFLFSILPFSINSKTENIKVSPLNW